jgi:hypothetical protein
MGIVKEWICYSIEREDNFRFVRRASDEAQQLRTEATFKYEHLMRNHAGFYGTTSRKLKMRQRASADQIEASRLCATVAQVI